VVVSVTEAAQQLGLDPGRVRRLVASGMLAGDKIGGRWLVDEVAIDDRLATHHRGGRPLSPRSAWGLLWAAAGRPSPWLAPNERSRAIDRARAWPLTDWAWACTHRAQVRRLWAHPAALSRLIDDDRVVRSGISVRGLSVDLIVSNEAEMYVHPDHVVAVIAEFGLINSRNSNVTVRVPPIELWLFEASDAPWPVVAVDLLDAGDDRSIRAAYGLVGRMTTS
jgi:excisionase family DNA binding protein